MYIGNWSVKKKENGFVHRVLAVVCFWSFFFYLIRLQFGWALLNLILSVLNTLVGWSFSRWNVGNPDIRS